MKKMSNILWGIFIAIMLGYCIFLIVKRFSSDHISKNNVVYTKAVIINDRNYLVNHRATNEFTYSYSFVVNGETYIGDSQDESVKIGDTVEILYDKGHPSLNKPVHPTE